MSRVVVVGTAIAAIAILGVVFFLRGDGGDDQSAPPPTSAIDISGQPLLGDATAPVTLVIFADFKCPFCRAFDTEVLPLVIERYVNTGKVRVAFVNFPFIAPDSQLAAAATECVAAQNQAATWGYIDTLFRSQGDERVAWATPELLKSLAGKVGGVDQARFDRCLDGGEQKARVEADLALARGANVRFTPSVFVDGKLVENPSLDRVEAAIAAAGK